MDGIVWGWVFIAFTIGYGLGLFPSYYVEYKNESERKKRADAAKVKYFKHLNCDFKKWIYKTYSEGATLGEERTFRHKLEAKENYSYFIDLFFNYEYVKDNQVKFTINEPTERFLKKHPELLDCVK